MATYDILMLAILVAATVFGAIKGFAWQLASITSIAGSYGVAYRFRDPVAGAIDLPAPWNRFLAMLILFILTSLLVWSVFRVLSHWIDKLKLRDFDNHVGAVFGLVKGSLYCILATLFAITLAGQTIRAHVAASHAGRAITTTLRHSESMIPPELHEFLSANLAKPQKSLPRGV